LTPYDFYSGYGATASYTFNFYTNPTMWAPAAQLIGPVPIRPAIL